MTDRIDGFLRRLGRLNLDDLTVLALGPVDIEERDRLLDGIDAAARAAGRLDEVDEAADRADDFMFARFSDRGFEPTWLGVTWGRSVGRVEDRTRLIQAVEDAAMAAVVADLAPADAARLSEPFELLATMAGAAPAGPPRSRRTGRGVSSVALIVATVSLVAATWYGIVRAVADALDQPSALLRF